MSLLSETSFQDLYPFQSHFMRVSGGNMHYLDQGQGEPIVLLHGNPTWSFLYREFVDPLSKMRRVIAPDHLGFGLSDKPLDADYTLDWHIQNLCEFVLRLDLSEMTLVIHDWGGPIGLGFAIKYPHLIQRLVILNTWAFNAPIGTRLHPLLSSIRQDGVGERLVIDENILIEKGIPGGIYHRDGVTNKILDAYRFPFLKKESRNAMLKLVREIPIGQESESAKIMGEIESKLSSLDIPVQIIWGIKDPIFSPLMIQKWQAHFPKAHWHYLKAASHFLQEDESEEILNLMQNFLSESIE